MNPSAANNNIHNTLGRHVIVDLSGCPGHLLNDADHIEKVFSTAVDLAGAHVITKTAHRFEPHGVTMFFALSESHLSIHTWPETGYASVDMYTCGNCDPAKACKYIAQELKAAVSYESFIQRGLHREPCAKQIEDPDKDFNMTFYHEIRERS